MRKMVLLAGLVLVVVSSPAWATTTSTISLSGTFTGVDSDTGKDNGVGNYDYAMAARTQADTFYVSTGSPMVITGTVDVRGLASACYFQVGLVDKAQADTALDAYGRPSLMFNNSALATFYAGTSNYARLTDDNALNSGKLTNPAGAVAGVFNFELDILTNGTMKLTLHGNSDVSTTYTYGHRNWWDDPAYWSGAGELANGGYLIAQLWIDTGNTTTPVSATYNITGTGPVVPEPLTMTCLFLGIGGVGAYIRKRRLA
jgi:hypothetical protein